MDVWQYSFSKVEYLTIFSAFIYGYIATRFFSGWGLMIGHRKELVFSKEHFAWTLFAFVLLVDIWWGSWSKGVNITQTPFLFYLSILSPLVFFLISVTLFPLKAEFQGLNFRDFFISIRKKIYILFICLCITFYINDTFLQDSPIITDYIVNTGGISLGLAGLILMKRWFDRTIITLAWILLLLHVNDLKVFSGSLDFIEGFSLTEYLTIFLTFLYGAVASRFFMGWGHIYNNWETVTISKKYLAWTLLAFGLLMDMWYGSWEREPYISGNIWIFFLVLTIPIAYYLLSVVIFPDKIDKENDFFEFYQKNVRSIVVLFGATLVANLIVANALEEVQIITAKNIFRVSAIGLATSAIYINRLKFYDVVLILGWLLLIADSILGYI